MIRHHPDTVPGALLACPELRGTCLVIGRKRVVPLVAGTIGVTRLVRVPPDLPVELEDVGMVDTRYWDVLSPSPHPSGGTQR